MKTKFRAWDKYLKKMFHNVNPIFDDDGNLDFIIYEYGNTGYNMIEIDVKKWDSAMLYHYERAIPVELMQYTGLNDSNGVEIFEGDLLSIQIVRDAKKTVTIVFEDGAFGVKDELFGWGYGKEFYPLKTIINNHKVEIIGNIHENPELLEGE